MTSSLLLGVLVFQSPLANMRSRQVSEEPVRMPDDYFMTANKAFAVLPPAPIAGGGVVSATWDPSGQFLLIVKHHTPFNKTMMFEPELKGRKEELMLWNKADGKLTTIHQLSGAATFQETSWLPGSSTVLFQTKTIVPSGPKNPEPKERINIYSFTAGGSAPTSLHMSEWEVGSDQVALFVSPAQPLAFIYQVEFTPMKDPSGQDTYLAQAEYRMILNEGRTLIKLPHTEANYDIQWGALGKPYLHSYEHRTKLTTIKAIDMKTGALTTVPTMPPYRVPVPSLEPYTVTTSVNQVADSRLRTTLLVATGDPKAILPSILIAGDVQAFAVSPDFTRIAYVTDGSVFCRQVVEVPYTLFVQRLEAFQKMELLQQVKQLGTAANIFAADNDDHMPGPSDYADKLYPYLKNRKLFDGFVYTFKGGSIMDVNEPHKTPLGYVQGKGGKAVVYLDSSARWIPDKP